MHPPPWLRFCEPCLPLPPPISDLNRVTGAETLIRPSPKFFESFSINSSFDFLLLDYNLMSIVQYASKPLIILITYFPHQSIDSFVPNEIWGKLDLKKEKAIDFPIGPKRNKAARLETTFRMGGSRKTIPRFRNRGVILRRSLTVLGNAVGSFIKRRPNSQIFFFGGGERNGDDWTKSTVYSLPHGCAQANDNNLA